MSDVAPRILLLGAGRMGFALLSGWLARGLASRDTVVIEPHPAPAVLELAQQHKITLNPDHLAQPAGVAVIAVKPQLFGQAVPGFTRFLAPHTAIISIAAGKTLADMAALLGTDRPLIRVMPNTPAAIGAGISVACAAPGVTDATRALCSELLAAAGAVEWIADENLMNAVTAVSGSGPAYVFHFVECLTAAGVAAGLDPALAARLARVTVSGSGALLAARTGEDASSLRIEVASPGGTTEAALKILMGHDAFKKIMTEAVMAALRRGAELSKS